MIESGRSRPIALGAFDHGQRDAVLDAAARIEELRLGEDGLALEADQRRAADQIENVVCQHVRAEDSLRLVRFGQAPS